MIAAAAEEPKTTILPNQQTKPWAADADGLTGFHKKLLVALAAFESNSSGWMSGKFGYEQWLATWR